LVAKGNRTGVRKSKARREWQGRKNSPLFGQSDRGENRGVWAFPGKNVQREGRGGQGRGGGEATGWEQFRESRGLCFVAFKGSDRERARVRRDGEKKWSSIGRLRRGERRGS